MSCTCETYTCIKAFVNKCSEGVELPIVADYDGDMYGELYFNDMVSTFTVAVELNKKIVIPSSIVNENYVHELRLYRDGILYGCYHLRTVFSVNEGTHDLIPPSHGYLQTAQYVGNNAGSQVFGALLGYTLVTISMGGQDYTNEFWSQTGTTVTWLGGMTFNGQVVLNFK